MITLYHGSDVAVKLPMANAGRRNLDFGEGFYLIDKYLRFTGVETVKLD